MAEGRGFDDNEHAQSAAADEHVKKSHPQNSPTPATKHYHYDLPRKIIFVYSGII